MLGVLAMVIGFTVATGSGAAAMVGLGTFLVFMAVVVSVPPSVGPLSELSVLLSKPPEERSVAWLSRMRSETVDVRQLRPRR